MVHNYRPTIHQLYTIVHIASSFNIIFLALFCSPFCWSFFHSNSILGSRGTFYSHSNGGTFICMLRVPHPLTHSLIHPLERVAAIAIAVSRSADWCAWTYIPMNQPLSYADFHLNSQNGADSAQGLQNFLLKDLMQDNWCLCVKNKNKKIAHTLSFLLYNSATRQLHNSTT